MEYVDIPKDLFALHKYVTLVADIMFVNGFPLLITLSQDIRLYTAKYLPLCSAQQLKKSLTKIINVYSRGGFMVKLLLMNIEFEYIKD